MTRVLPTILGTCVLSAWWRGAVELDWRPDTIVGEITGCAFILAFMAYLGWAFASPLTALESCWKGDASLKVGLGLLVLAWTGNGLAVGVFLLVFVASLVPS